jgi:hypothetical protein
MHTISTTRLVAHKGCAQWRATLAASVASLLATVRPTCLRHLQVKQQNQACATGRVASRLAYPSVMLVESDVCQHSCGLVP